MIEEWRADIPIYKQLESRIISWILNEEFKEGEALPSVRKLSVEFQINHLTVAKSLQDLVAENILEKRRGLGMFVQTGAINKLKDIEKQKFIESELPKFITRLRELNIDQEELIQAIKQVEGQL